MSSPEKVPWIPSARAAPSVASSMRSTLSQSQEAHKPVGTLVNMTILERALRVGEGKKFKEFEKKVSRIADFEPELELESDEELRERYAHLRERFHAGEPLDELLPESFALTREAAKRTLEQRHFDVQLIGGMVLHDGNIAEMKTGEGKTLTSTLPVVLNALTARDEDGGPTQGKGVHV